MAGQREIIARMTAEEKLNASMALFHAAWQLKYAAFKQFYPGLPDDEVRKKVKEAFLYART